MKDGIHPQYRPVVFKDDSTGYAFLTRSTLKSEATIQWEDGKEYPLVKLDISSSSHPFYTGQQRLVDTAGRVERFRRRYSKEQKSGRAQGEVSEGSQTTEDAAAGGPPNADGPDPEASGDNAAE